MIRTATRVAGLATAGTLVAAHQRVFAIERHTGWPPSAGAVTADGAQAAVEAFAARDGVRSRDAALEFAWSTAATIDPWVDGETFFPRVLADVEAARSSIHILMFGWREGEIGMRLAELLERKLAEGVEVRAIVDSVGSKAYLMAKEMFTRLAAAGAEIVVNDVLPPTRVGLYGASSNEWRFDDFGRADHRKLYVLDGDVVWTGGAGIEDHFNDGRFHDVLVRVTGDVVRQAQAAFLTSFRGHGGPLGGDLSRYFPAPADPGTTPIALAQVIPGGFVAASEAIREQIDAARERLDIVNPYLTDAGIVEQLIAAARRGVKVRLIVSETSNNKAAAAALHHRYAELGDAGVELYEVPETVVHAKVVVADDVVSFGTVNLDAWALYRNSEIMMIARSPETAALMRERLVEPDVARSKPGKPPASAGARLGTGIADKLKYYL